MFNIGYLLDLDALCAFIENKLIGKRIKWEKYNSISSHGVHFFMMFVLQRPTKTTAKKKCAKKILICFNIMNHQDAYWATGARSV